MGQIASKSPKRYSVDSSPRRLHRKPKIQRFSTISDEVINEIDSLRSHRINKKIQSIRIIKANGHVMIC